MQIDLDALKSNILTFRSFLKNNRDPLYGDEPLTEFLKLDARHSMYVSNIQKIIRTYPKAQLVDNLAVKAANSERSRVHRIAGLKFCLAEYPDGDALPEAMYWLGEALREDSQFEHARSQFQELIDRFPGTSWAGNARRQLAGLSAVLSPADKSGTEAGT